MSRPAGVPVGVPVPTPNRQFRIPTLASALSDWNRARPPSVERLEHDPKQHGTPLHFGDVQQHTRSDQQGTPVVASLLRQMDEDPVELLQDVWAGMLKTKAFYDHQLAEARTTLAKVNWFSPSINEASFRCNECQSELIEQVEVSNLSQRAIELQCKTCGAFHDIDDAVEEAVERLFGADGYMRAKETGESGPVFTCPSCDRETLLEEDGGCANCGEAADYASECMRCGNSIDMREYLEGLAEGLCSYCAYIKEKVMQED
jgi:transcription elongation factor Elf1